MRVERTRIAGEVHLEGRSRPVVIVVNVIVLVGRGVDLAFAGRRRFGGVQGAMHRVDVVGKDIRRPGRRRKEDARLG